MWVQTNPNIFGNLPLGSNVGIFVYMLRLLSHQLRGFPQGRIRVSICVYMSESAHACENVCMCVTGV